jgi:hypothetical protein
VPLDARLQLPQGKHSYLLQDWDQELVVDRPFASVSSTLARMLGFTQSVHTLEREQREMATAVEAFWQERPIPPSAEEGQLLVCTADGKGVPMRGAAKAPTASSPPQPPGCVPEPRRWLWSGLSIRWTGSCARPRRCWRPCLKKRPQARRRHARGRASSTCGPPCSAMTGTRPNLRCKRSSAGWPSRWRSAIPTGRTRSSCSWTARTRCGGPACRRQAGWTYLPEGLAEVTEILDLLHALGYLWQAAFLFHPNDRAAARAFVKTQARRMLHGEIAAVIHALRWLGTHHKLKGQRRETLEGICGYFHNHPHRMAYDVYLEHGFPIASGVIEGACRCVVKDRMERSGMRWVMSGARPMLDMRCIHLSGLWEEFTAFRIQRESQRLYSGSAANDPDFSQPLAA